MKRKNTSETRNYKMPHIFRDDLLEIEAIIKETAKAREFSIATDSYEYDGVDEIPNDLQKLHKVEIKSHDPYVSISFTGYSAWAHADTDLKAKGVLAEVSEVISKRERKFLWLLAQLSTWASGFATFLGLGLAFVQGSLWWLFMSGVGVAWFLWGLFQDMKAFSTVEFVSRSARPSFFVRNRDQLIVGVIVAIVSVVLTLLFTNR